MNIKIISLLLLSILTIELTSQNCSPDSLIVRSIEARETDINIRPEAQSHRITFNPDCNSNEKLLLHLVGSFDDPASTTFFPALAANNGYKCINLKYNNLRAAFSTCKDSPDRFCYGRFREEIIFGEDRSEEVSVDSSESIFNRFEKLLIYLHDNYPDEGWGEFLSITNGIDWSNIVLSGHSQGGGHAAFIAKLFEVDRVLMFASPNDYSLSFEEPAPWTNFSSNTPDSNYYVFGNLFDRSSDFSNQFEIWEEMSLLNNQDSLLIDDIISCYSFSSNILYSKDNRFTGLAGNHSSMIIDEFTPITSGNPDFVTVWEYMLGLCDTRVALSNIKETPQTKVFPNPSNGEFYVESEFPITSIEVFNLMGNKIRDIQTQQTKLQIHIENYEGVVFIKVNTVNFQSIITRLLLTEK